MPFLIVNGKTFRWRVGLKKEVETHVTLPKWLDNYILINWGRDYFDLPKKKEHINM